MGVLRPVTQEPSSAVIEEIVDHRKKGCYIAVNHKEIINHLTRDGLIPFFV